MADIGEKNYLTNGVAQESTVQNIITQVDNVATNASTAATKATAAASDAASVKSTIGTVNTNVNSILNKVNSSGGNPTIKSIQSGRVNYAWQSEYTYYTNTWKLYDYGAAYVDITISPVSNINKCIINIYSPYNHNSYDMPNMGYLINATTLRLIYGPGTTGLSEGQQYYRMTYRGAFKWEVIEFY